MLLLLDTAYSMRLTTTDEGRLPPVRWLWRRDAHKHFRADFFFNLTHSYLAEFAQGDKRSSSADESLKAYQSASEIAASSLGSSLTLGGLSCAEF